MLLTVRSPANKTSEVIHSGKNAAVPLISDVAHTEFDSVQQYFPPGEISLVGNE